MDLPKKKKEKTKVAEVPAASGSAAAMLEEASDRAYSERIDQSTLISLLSNHVSGRQLLLAESTERRKHAMIFNIVLLS